MRWPNRTFNTRQSAGLLLGFDSLVDFKLDGGGVVCAFEHGEAVVHKCLFVDCKVQRSTPQRMHQLVHVIPRLPTGQVVALSYRKQWAKFYWGVAGLLSSRPILVLRRSPILGPSLLVRKSSHACPRAAHRKLGAHGRSLTAGGVSAALIASTIFVSIFRMPTSTNSTFFPIR